MEKPHNVIENSKDDTGKSVLVTTFGKDLEDNLKCVLYKAKGKVVWGPHQLWYLAMTKAKKDSEKMVQKKYITNPYWCIHLEGFDSYIYFQEKELTFV